MPPLDAKTAARLARVALTNVATEYPYHVVHLLRDDADVQPPRRLHPAFHGSYDWHSCVHMHWTLARCLRRFPSLESADAIRAQFDARLTVDHLAQELAYFQAPGRASFERPYGWGWLLALADELAMLAAGEPAASRWSTAVAALADHIATQFVLTLPRLDYPVRTGSHNNTAFALILARRYACGRQHAALRRAIEGRAHHWFSADRRYPANYEPGGDEFLSAGLCEAVLMQRVLDGCDFTDWWSAFEPGRAALAHWLEPARVSDPTDPKIVHLHGLNLSRAWCWRSLVPDLPADLRAAAETAIDAHLAASLPAAVAGDYVGTHWLASFALLALDTGT